MECFPCLFVSEWVRFVPERRDRIIIYHKFYISVEEHMNKREKERLRCELETYRDMGVMLFLNGRETTPKRIEKAYKIAEEGEYMRDYIQDEEGRLRGLSFDYIRE